MITGNISSLFLLFLDSQQTGQTGTDKKQTCRFWDHRYIGLELNRGTVRVVTIHIAVGKLTSPTQVVSEVTPFKAKIFKTLELMVLFSKTLPSGTDP